MNTLVYDHQNTTNFGAFLCNNSISLSANSLLLKSESVKKFLPEAMTFSGSCSLTLVSKSVTAEDLQSLMSGWFSVKLNVLESQVQRAKPVDFDGQG